MEQNKLKLLIIAALVLVGCSKNINEVTPTCEFYTLLSDKYTGDSVYLKTDTLWGRVGQYAYACNRDLDSMRANKVQWYWCAEFGECLRYEFSNKKTDPLIFK